jgi:hypothetical protein
MPPGSSKNYNYSYKLIYAYHGYIIHKAGNTFPQTLLHYQHSFFHLCMRRCMPIASNSSLKRRSSSRMLCLARRRPQNDVLRVYPLGVQKCGSRLVIIRDCRNYKDLILLPVGSNSSKSLF